MVPLNFLLGCSELSLDNYELARMAEVADLRKEFHALFDRLIEQWARTMLAKWFRESDRDSINQALTPRGRSAHLGEASNQRKRAP